MEGMSDSSAFAGIIGPFVGVIYIVIAVLYFFPVLFLYNFSSKSLVAVRELDTEFLTMAIDNLRKHFKFIGILTIVVLVSYAIFFIGLMVGGLVGAFS